MRRTLLGLLSCVLALPTLFVLSPPQVATAAVGAPTFTWSMPDRFGLDADGDHVIDEIDLDTPSSFVAPSSWRVDFDACANGAPAGATYSWSFGGAVVDAGGACTASYQFPAVDTPYDVTLAITVDGATSTTTETILPRDYVIVAMGDSGASGEGNPDYLQADFSGTDFGSLVFTPKWNDARCHRSALAGPAQAALRIEQRDPHSSVTFVHTACSGARITRGLLGPYQGIAPGKDHLRLDCDDPDFENPYRPGEFFYVAQPDPALDAPTPDDPACIPSQLSQVQTILSGREIDVVNLLIGINDISFSKVAFTCLAEDDCSTARSTFMRDPDNRMQTATEFLAPRKAQLADRYRALTDAIMTELPLRDADAALGIADAHVFYDEYPDATISDDGTTVCSSNEKEFTNQFPQVVRDGLAAFLTGLTVDPDAGTINQTEWRWAGEAITGFLNDARNDAVAAANAAYPGRFSAATGSWAAFHGHGYCAQDKWFRSVLESMLYQRDPEGSLHPNRAGHFYAYALPLEDVWAEHLGVTAPELPATVGGTIESFEGISQSFAPLFEVLSRTDIAGEIAKLFPLGTDDDPTTGQQAGPGFLGYFRIATKGIADHIATSLTSKTIAELDEELDGLDSQIGPLTLDVDAHISPHDLTDHYEAIVDVSLHGPLGSFSLDTGGLALPGPETEVTASTRLRFVIEPDRPRDRVYLRADDHPAFRFSVAATETIPSDAPVGAQLGPIAVAAHGPADGSPAIAVDTALELRPRDIDHDGEISADELVGGSFAGNFDVVCDPTSSVDVDVALSAGIAGLSGDVARLSLHDGNVCDGVDTPTLDFATPDLEGLESMGPEQVIELVTALALTVERIAATGDVDLPFSADDIHDVLAIAATIRETADALAAGTTPPTLQAALAAVEQALALPAGTLALRYDATTHRLAFDLVYDASIDDAQLPIDLGLLERAGIVGTDTTAHLGLDASAHVALGVAIDLTRQADDTPTDELLTVSDRLLVATSSELTLDGQATLGVDATGRIGFVPVDVSVGAPGGGPVGLLTKPNASEPLVRIGLTGPAGATYVSLADLLSGDAGRAGISGSVNAGLAPVAASVVASLGGTPLGSGSVTVRWDDLSQLQGPSGPQVTADAAFARDLLRFSVLDPVQTVGMLLGGVRDVADGVVDVARRNEQLARSLPLVGAGYDDIVAGFSDVADAADELASLHRDLTLPEMEAALEGAVADALGVPVDGVRQAISLELDRSQPRTALVLHLDLCQASEVSAACAAARPVSGTFAIDAGGLGVVGVDGAVALQLDYLAALRLDVALELPAVEPGTDADPLPHVVAGEAGPRLVVLGSSGVEAELGGSVDLNASPTGTFRGYAGPAEVSFGLVGTRDGAAFSDPAHASASVRFVVDAGLPADQRLGVREWVAAVLDHVGSAGVTDHSAAWTAADCPTTGQEGCAVLPVYLRAADGDVIAKDGTKWIRLGDGPVTWSAGRLFDTTTWSADVPESILTDLEARALSASSIVAGIRYLVEQAKAALDGANIGQEVPILGDAYAAGSSALADLDAFMAKVEGIAATIDSASTAGAMQSTITSFFVTNIGPNSSLKLLRDNNGDGVVNAADVSVVVLCGDAPCASSAPILDVTDVQLDLAVGRLATATAPPFRFGVPGLRIQSDSPAEASAGWRVEFRGGVDRDGFYLVPATTSGTAEVTVGVTASMPDTIDATIAGLPVTLTDQHDSAPDLQLALALDLLGGADDRLRLQELIGRGTDLLDADSVAFTASGCADLQLGFEVRVPGASTGQSLPSILGDLGLHADWNGCPGSAGAPVDVRAGLAPVADVTFENVRLDAGKTATNYIASAAREVKRITGPLDPVVRTVRQDIPVVSDLSRLVGGGSITWLDAWEASQTASGNDVTGIVTLVKLTDFVNQLGAGGVPQVQVPIVDSLTIDLAAGDVRYADPDEAFDRLIEGVPVAQDVLGELEAAGWTLHSRIDAVADESRGAEFSFPAFEEPIQFLQLLFGKDIDLVRFDAGTIHAEQGFDYWYGLPFAKVGVRGSASIDGHVAISYDTAGIRRAIANPPVSWSSVGSLVHGLGLEDLDERGRDVPELHMEADVGLYAYVGVPGLSARASGGVEGVLDIDLHDPDGDGKVRYEEVKARVRNPACLFDSSGRIDAYARVTVETPFGDADKDIVDPYVLYEFPDIQSWCTQQETSGGGGFEIPAPVLASQSGATLTLNVGTLAANRHLGGDTSEVYSVVDLGDGSVAVTGFGYTQVYGSPASPVTNIYANFGQGDDAFSISHVTDGPNASPIFVRATGGNGDDVLSGGAGADQLQGDAGADQIRGYGGNDILIGGDDDDVIKGGTGSDTINGDLASTSSTGDDLIDGGPDRDTIRPQNGRDRVIAGDGDDLVDGEWLGVPGVATGPDYIDGGDGGDTLNGSGDGDVIIGGVNTTPSVAVVDYIDGKGGDDCIVADNGTGQFVTTDGVTTCSVTPWESDVERDSVRGGQGADIIFGQAGDDSLSGDDQSNGDTGDDVIDGGLGNDTLTGAGGDDHLIGGPGNDTLAGDTGDDLVEGGEGNDTIRGGAGGDTLVGDAGNDTLWTYAATNTTVPDAANHADGGPGNDTLNGSTVRDVLTGGEGDDVLNGDAGPDLLDGGDGVDVLDGGAGDDQLFGGPGHDRLTGRAGADALDGGTGDDELVGDVTALIVSGATTFPDGRPRYNTSTDLTIGGPDTFVSGGGSDTVWDVELDPASEVSRTGLTLVVTTPPAHGIANGSPTGRGFLPQESTPVWYDFQLLSGTTVVGTGRFSISYLDNRAPVAADDAFTTPQGRTVDGSVLRNDSDPDGDRISVQPTSGTTVGGSYSVTADGHLVYTPRIDFTGPTDAFTYTVTDGQLTATATVTIGIDRDTTPPLVGCTAPAGWSADEVVVRCVANDAGVGLADPADGVRTSTTAVGAGNEETVWIVPAEVCDAAGNCARAPQLSASVDRRPPTVTSANDGAEYTLGTQVALDLQCDDGGAGVDPATCDGQGSPLDSGLGEHVVDVTVRDLVGNTTHLAIRYVVVAGANRPPIADDDAATIDQGRSVTLDVLDGDVDPDGDELAVVAADGVTEHGGRWAVTADGTATYVADPAYAGPTDSFPYTVVDGNGGAATASVTITIVADTVAPHVECESVSGWYADDVQVRCTASDDGSGLAAPGQASVLLTTSVAAGTEQVVALDPLAVCDRAGNCTDLPAFEVGIDRKAPTVTSANDGSVYPGGTAVVLDLVCDDGGSGVDPTTCVGGTALPSDTGDHTVTVTVADLVGNTTELTIGYRVDAAPNRAPVAAPDRIEVGQGWLASTDVLVNDSDPDGDAISVVADAGVTEHGGRWRVDVDGTASYIADPAYAGPDDRFEYTLEDERGATAVGVVDVAIEADVDGPVVTCDDVSGWHAANVTVGCTASDAGSGLADPRQATTSLTTSVADGAELVTSVDPVAVCDRAGNCTDPAPIAVQVDRKAPVVTSANEGATYTLPLAGPAPVADVVCTDGGSGLAAGTCVGGGEPLDLTVGSHSFVVEATDAVGNTTTLEVSYSVVAAGLTVSLDDVAVTEGDLGIRIARVPVRLSEPADTTVTATVSITRGTASSNDYLATGPVTVTFTPNRRTGLTPTVAYVPVIVVSDRRAEPDETLIASIVSVSTGSIGRSPATVTIVDDD